MKYSKIFFTICIGAAAMTACTDTWDEHYNSNAVADNHATRNLWQLIEADKELQYFADVLRVTEYDVELNANQQLTLWAVPISEKEAEEWITLYAYDYLSGVKRADNRAIVRFVQNHLSQYNRMVTAQTENDTVKMLNGKYKHLSFDNIDGTSLIDKNVLATNGVLYKIPNTLPFFNNVYEELCDRKEFSEITDFLKSYNEYELDEDASVPGDIVDGKLQYLDSVTYLSNDLMRSYRAYIMREDSSYAMLAPTNDVWNAQVERYKKYFRYPKTTSYRDSIQELTAKQAVFCSRFFNINPQVNSEMRKDESSRDSIMSTVYNNLKWEQYVYYKPYAAGGIFADKKQVQCSNGFLYIDDVDGTISPKKTFASDKTYNAVSSNLWVYGSDNSDVTVDGYNDYLTLRQEKAEVVKLKQTDSLTIYNEDSTVVTKKPLSVKGDSYIVFSTSSGKTQFSYNLQGLLSGLYYNVYFVFMPAAAADDPQLSDSNKPAKFEAYLHELNADEVRGKGTNKATYIYNLQSPTPNDQTFETRLGVVDTICMLKSHQFNYACDGTTDVAWIYFQTSGTNADYRNGRYTRSVRVGAMILRAFETEEEAEKDYNEYLQSRSSK